MQNINYYDFDIQTLYYCILQKVNNSGYINNTDLYVEYTNKLMIENDRFLFDELTTILKIVSNRVNRINERKIKDLNDLNKIYWKKYFKDFVLNYPSEYQDRFYEDRFYGRI
jgi:hypothetical protein